MIEHFFTAPFWYPFLKISELIELLPAVFLNVAVLQNIFRNRVYTNIIDGRSYYSLWKKEKMNKNYYSL